MQPLDWSPRERERERPSSLGLLGFFSISSPPCSILLFVVQRNSPTNFHMYFDNRFSYVTTLRKSQGYRASIDFSSALRNHSNSRFVRKYQIPADSMHSAPVNIWILECASFLKSFPSVSTVLAGYRKFSWVKFDRPRNKGEFGIFIKLFSL